MSVIYYQISVADSSHHLFQVSFSFPTQTQQTYTLSLPAWLPGSYMIRDFAKNIIQPTAKSNNEEKIALIPQDKQTWKITATDEVTHVSYQVFAFDLSVRTAYLDNERGFFNGSSTFLAVEELSDAACHLKIVKPENNNNWRVATGLLRADITEKYTFGDYYADDYQMLIDCPVAIGDFDVSEFTVEGVVHHMVFTSKHYGDTERLCQDVGKLCQHHIDIFGEAPFKEYWFITHLLAQGFGGLEHKNSTILQASRFDLPNINKPDELTENYKTFLSLCSHEYFHAWNICRIKPKAFIPYNLNKESYTTQLWAYEGITSYYDDFSLFRTGIISFENYLQIINKAATRVYRGAGLLKQSVEESSFYTWTKFYQQGPDAVNNITSYYGKGALIALWLDLTIRKYSDGQYSLDNVMRELWIHFGRVNVGTTTEDFINITNVLCQQNLTQEINDILTKTGDVPLESLLAEFGIEIQKSKFKTLNSLETITTENYQPFVGAMYKNAESGIKISSVIEYSPAAKAGWAVNDVVVAIDNVKINEQTLQKLADHLPPNKPVNCHYFRDDQLLVSSFAFTDSPTKGIIFNHSDKDQSAKWQKVIKN